MKLALLTYSYVEDMAERRTPHRAEHLALIESFRAQGRLLIAGATGEPPSGGALVFRDHQAATEFVSADPYGRAGLVTRSSIEPWTVVAHGPLPDDDSGGSEVPESGA